MKKFDGRHRKRIGRKKKELMKWRTLRAQAMRVPVPVMQKIVRYCGDPLAAANHQL